jgi:small subunit ribosomal protein S8
MPVTDTIADFLTRIRNAGNAKHKHIAVPCSTLKLAIAAILKDQGFIADYEKIDEGPQGVIKITLKYYKKEHVISNMTRISKSGRRIYSSADKLPRVKNGLGIAIISTSQGLITDKEARRLNIGGEVLCTIW